MSSINLNMREGSLEDNRNDNRLNISIIMNPCGVIRVDSNNRCRWVFNSCCGSSRDGGRGTRNSAINVAIKVVGSKEWFKHSFTIAMITWGEGESKFVRVVRCFLLSSK